MEDRHLSLSEVAELMEVAERTVRRWIKSGKLRAYKPGRDYRIPESALKEFIEGSEAYPKAAAPRKSGPSEKPGDTRHELIIGPGVEELRRVEYELKPGAPVDEVLAKLTTSGEGALGAALADLVFEEWSDDEASNSAAHKAARQLAAKINTDPGTLLKRLIDNQAFVAHRVKAARESQRATGGAGAEGKEETA